MDAEGALDIELRSAAVVVVVITDDMDELEEDCWDDCCCAWTSLICGLWKGYKNGYRTYTIGCGMNTEVVQNICTEKKQNIDDWKQGKAFPKMLITDHVLEAQIDMSGISRYTCASVTRIIKPVEKLFYHLFQLHSERDITNIHLIFVCLWSSKAGHLSRSVQSLNITSLMPILLWYLKMK